MSDVVILIDGREVRTRKGRRVLAAALDAGIEIPHLCGVETEALPFGACRLCYVEVQGRDRPVTSCELEARDGLVVSTRSPAVDRLVSAAFHLILSTHPLPCKGCPGHKRCVLQDIAKMRGLIADVYYRTPIPPLTEREKRR